MKIKITRFDIKLGRDGPTRNPVARAVARAQGGGCASVYYSNILSTKGVFETPEEVCHWLGAWRQGGNVPEAEFELELDSEYWMPSSWQYLAYWERPDGHTAYFDECLRERRGEC